MDTLKLTGDVTLDLTAAADGQPKPAKFSIVAYTGGPMRPFGYPYPVIIDVAASRSRTDPLPLLVDHNASMSAIAGQGTLTKAGDSLVFSGTLADSEAARNAIALVKSGIKLQASIGASTLSRERIEPGQTVKVNGREFTAPAEGLLVAKVEIAEVSLVPIGADGKTSVSIKAGKTMNPTQTESNNAAQTQTQTLTAAGDDYIRAERERIAEITRDASRLATSNDANNPYRLIAAQAVAEGWTPDQARSKFLTTLIESRGTGPAIHANRPDVGNGDIRAAQLLCHMGQERAALSAYGERTTEAARAYPIRHIADLAASLLNEQGLAVPRTTDGVIRAAFSTVAFPGIMSDAANKVSIDAYKAVPSVAKLISKKLSANDFKAHTGYRLTGAANFDELAPGGEIKHGSLAEQSYAFRVDTYAKMFGLTRHDVINDDLGKLAEVPQLLGRGAALKLEEMFWTLVLANTGSFFAEANKNALTAALGNNGLATAVAKMRQMTDTQGKPIMVSPKYLVCPPELESTADILYASTNVVIAGQTDAERPNANPFSGKYQPQVSPYLSNPAFTGYSATAWYLFGDPSDVAAFGIAYLNGLESPVIETQDADFNRLGVQFRGYMDFGVCQIDPRGAVKSTGEG